MPTIGWIDALRTYNAGMPSWCVPRKGTPGYEMVMRIRQGEKPKTFKELTEELERKTGGKPKKVLRTMAVDLAETQKVAVPTLDEAPKMEVSTTKSSGPIHKTMAVTPVQYVAEGGSKKEEEKKPLTELTKKELIELRSRLEKEYDAVMNSMLDAQKKFDEMLETRRSTMTRKEIDDAREEEDRLFMERHILHEKTREVLGLPAVEAELNARESKKEEPKTVAEGGSKKKEKIDWKSLFAEKLAKVKDIDGLLEKRPRLAEYLKTHILLLVDATSRVGGGNHAMYSSYVMGAKKTSDDTYALVTLSVKSGDPHYKAPKRPLSYTGTSQGLPSSPSMSLTEPSGRTLTKTAHFPIARMEEVLGRILDDELPVDEPKTVAEGGSNKTREELIEEFHKLGDERRAMREAKKTRTKAYKELDERRDRIGAQLGGIYNIAGPNRIRISNDERESKTVAEAKGKKEEPKKD